MNPAEQSPVKLGIVGCGRATTELHLPALKFVAGAEVVALADSNPEALHHTSRQFNIERCVPDYRTLLEDQTIEAIAICVPAQCHVEIALAALNAGKHLFIEKPLAVTLEECDQLIEGAAGTPLRIMVGFNTRYHRLTQQARSLLRKCAFGQLENVRSVLTSCHNDVPDWRRRRASGGGVLFEMAMHHFDLWRYLLGKEIEEICACSRSGLWEDESATVSARLSCGALVSGTFAECTTQNNSLDIYGREGSLSLSFYRFDGLERAVTSDIPGNIPARLRGLHQFIKGLPQAVRTLRQGGEWLQSYVEEWRQFVTSIRTGVPVECGLEDGRRALAVALGAIESTDTGKTITISKR